MYSQAAEKIEVNNPCICCGASRSDLFFRTRFPQYPGHFEYRRCGRCGLVFNSPRLADLSVLYDKDYFFFQKDGEGMRYHVLRQIQHMVLPTKAFTSGKRLVEVGSARGHLLDALKQLGFDVQGVEPSADAVATARATYGVAVFHGTVQQYLKSGQPRESDIVLSCTVLEHVDAPDLFVDSCAALLKPNGILVMDMPNIDSLNAQAAGPAWEMYQKYHIYLFSPQTIRLLLEKHHFEVICTFSYDNYLLTAKNIRHLKIRRSSLLSLDCIGLYGAVRSCYRQRRHIASTNANGFRPITKNDIENLQPYESSRDAKGPGAAKQQGDHIVVIARKI